ncbi:hypothetical protein FLAVO9AF_120052 [Flavobacterium sp. 9AF]|uniref:hypothetical protein n=1 Tax=Flavobacterium sp. 9AF TaxID=2653142 RepID=UPI0012F340CA|nr:hypothetical protein [Flavobacterium sp. 9AF]VXB19762.1 hypothetical protein FLAVO9AF_120052 [Flavobacterium sp. 9AF]
MIKYLAVLLIFLLEINNFNDEFYTFRVFLNNEPVKNGYIHFLSNDELINDISTIGLDLEEKYNKKCKIDKNGFLKINKKYLQKKHNNIGKDSMRCIVRCGHDFGVWEKFKISDDTIKINIIFSEYKDCFMSRKESDIVLKKCVK